jgi:hypothetical protein
MEPTIRTMGKLCRELILWHVIQDTMSQTNTIRRCCHALSYRIAHFSFKCNKINYACLPVCDTFMKILCLIAMLCLIAYFLCRNCRSARVPTHACVVYWTTRHAAISKKIHESLCFSERYMNFTSSACATMRDQATTTYTRTLFLTICYPDHCFLLRNCMPTYTKKSLQVHELISTHFRRAVGYLVLVKVRLRMRRMSL